jgi:hypothetical protein
MYTKQCKVSRFQWLYINSLNKANNGFKVWSHGRTLDYWGPFPWDPNGLININIMYKLFAQKSKFPTFVTNTWHLWLLAYSGSVEQSKRRKNKEFQMRFTIKITLKLIECDTLNQPSKNLQVMIEELLNL